MMELLRGSAAAEAVGALLASHAVPAVAVDPRAREGEPLSLLCVATPECAVLVDARGAPEALAILARADRPLAAEEAKATHRALVRAAGCGPDRWACARLSAQLLAAGRPTELTLEALSVSHGMPAPPAAEAGFEQLLQRTRAVAELIDRMIPLLKQADMAWVSRIEAAAVAPIAEMELAGMPFDAACWRQLDAAARAERGGIEGRLREHLAPVCNADLFGGAAINLDSDADLRAALAALGMSLPDMRRHTLAVLPPPLGPVLARFRELGKVVSAYGEAFLEHVRTDGRIHPSFEQIGASTGRMACHSPNLQAMVKDAPYRACFAAAEHRRLIVGDYAACELRILAEMSGDPVFAEAFARGEDLHARVASAVFGKPVSKSQNPELRERAKAINFGLAYGMGAGGLARATDTGLDQARALLERYFQTFPRIRAFLETSARESLARGWARTMTGRRLVLETQGDRASRAQAERIAKNMPIQGTSADITKIALARLRRRLAGLHEARIVNTVHDEIVVECDAAEAEAAREAVAEEMQRAGAEVLRSIPVAVDVGVSRSWQK